MVPGRIPALTVQNDTLYLEVGNNAFNTPEVKTLISDLTNRKVTGLGLYDTRLVKHAFGAPYETDYYVGAWSTDEDILSGEGLAKRSGECVLTIRTNKDGRHPLGHFPCKGLHDQRPH